ncbi:MAG: OPT family oligopeptide transporter [Verrucomicrobia bacterium]|nr:MAG: OPT family oligopeptide transporter [Verrucomicrobiota bacterium]
MAIKQLTEEQVRTWTLAQKDRWWFENVWRGDMPQLTLRSGATGMILGGLLSLTNLYVGAKTGWTLGVGITSVILAFALFKVMARVGLADEFTVLENNAMQSIATAAGYMTAPMISSLAAYMLVTDTVIPMSTTLMWVIAIASLGVLFAFPLKRRFINDEQHPFPEGRAAGIVMDALHTSNAADGLFKARILVVSGAIAAFLELLKSSELLERVKLGLLAIPAYLDEWFYLLSARWFNWTPNILGVDLRQLTVRPDTDFVMMAAGGLMGIRTGVSLLIGAVINYCILAPWMIAHGDIQGTMVDGRMTYGFRAITMWSLWGGVAMMTTASLFAFFSRPQILVSAFRGMFRRRQAEPDDDILRDIELPMKVFVIGIPVLGGLVVYLAHRFFGVEVWLGIIAIPLIFVFTLIGVNSTALTSITPTGALGKLTQLTYGVLAPGNITTNLMTAGITAEVAGNASNLLMDIKPGYMLGAKPRQQAIGHVLGILAGALVSVPVFYAMFLHDGVAGLNNPEYPMPAATIWKGVAEMLTKGLSELPVTARWAAVIGALLGILFEALKLVTRGRFWLSAVGLGLAAVIPFNTCFAMFLGSFLFWLAGRVWKDQADPKNRLFVQNQEPICGGVIAGGALMGILLTLVTIRLSAGAGH